MTTTDLHGMSVGDIDPEGLVPTHVTMQTDVGPTKVALLGEAFGTHLAVTPVIAITGDGYDSTWHVVHRRTGYATTSRLCLDHARAAARDLDASSIDWLRKQPDLANDPVAQVTRVSIDEFHRSACGIFGLCGAS